jgi:divalent metal cation (Fe/Co/Zn/Cd) transporter
LLWQAGKSGHVLVKTTFQVVLSLFILIVGYECMVEAFHMLNQPSDRAVYMGMAILGLLCVLVPMVLWQVWRKRRGNFR